MKNRLLICSLAASCMASMMNPAFSDWSNWSKKADEVFSSSTAQNTAATLSNDKISQGLKEALDVGVKKAIALLGSENGFLNDQSVKIPLPDKMQKVEKALRSFGQEKMADDFVTSMNRAAEQAVPKVTNVFVDAIAKMSLDDAQGILSGGDTAATDYFKKHTTEQMRDLISPYVNDAMNQTQVTQYYKTMADQVKKYDSFGLMDSYLGSATDIDSYVTDKTMEGLFTKIAEQEKLIRQNPGARSTELLKEVFGSMIQ